MTNRKSIHVPSPGLLLGMYMRTCSYVEVGVMAEQAEVVIFVVVVLVIAEVVVIVVPIVVVVVVVVI